MYEGAFSLLISGFCTNLLIVACASLLPLIIGAIVVFPQLGGSAAEPHPAWGLIECVAPIPLLLWLFYIEPDSSANVMVILVLSVCHLGFIPRHIRGTYSVRRFILCAVDLLSTLFKWSMIAGFVAGLDLVRAAGVIHGRIYTPDAYAYALGLSVAFLLLLQGLRYVLSRILKTDDAENPR